MFSNKKQKGVNLDEGEMGRKWEEIGRGNLNQNLSHKNEFSLKQIRMKIKFYFIIALL